MSRKRSSFTPEFKDELVKLYLEQRASKTVSQVARENGVGTETLRAWVKAYERAHPQDEEPLTVSERARLRELEREVRELRLERGRLQMLQRGVHKSVQALEADIRSWITNWNDDPKPFVWTKTAEEILDSLKRYLQRISGGGH